MRARPTHYSTAARRACAERDLPLSQISQRILLVEPLETVRRTLSAYLESNGFEVESVDSEVDAISRLGGGYGVVILDLVLTGRRGFAVIEHIVQRLPEMVPRVVVMTADDSERVRAELERIGVCDVVPKPIRAEQILAAVRDCLQSANAALH